MACGAGYFNAIAPIWRDMGWGQLAVTGNGILGYAYDTAGASGDAGDIQFIRSTDNGTTWSNPTKLNTDNTTREQWMPSLVGSPSGAMFASWYDRRDTAAGDNHYKYYGRRSTDGGATWQADAPVSDVLSPQPLQPDPNVQACWTGDYNHQGMDGNTALLAWVDGRVPINGNSQQDLFFDKVDMGNGVATPTVTPGGPTITPAPPTPTRTVTPGGPTNTPAPTNTTCALSSPNCGATPSPTDCPNVFVDITGNIFYGAIHYLYCNHVVNGTDATHYSPAGISTRGQFAKVVALGFGLPSYTPSGGAQDFSDVPSNNFAYQYIESGFHAGILSGFDQAGCTAHNATYPCYLPNIPITRGQLTKLVVGAAHYPLFTPTGGNPTFSDVPASNIFFAFIETAHNKGVINGYPDGTFRPNNNIRRDEMAQIVYKGVTTP
jgi:S-layer homology domain